MAPNHPAPIPAVPRHRWRIPALTWLLLVIAGGALALWPEMERNIRSWLLLALLALGALLTLAWFALLSGFSSRRRIAFTAGLVGLALATYLLVRVDGTISAVGFPRLVWRWTKSTPPQLAATPPASSPAEVTAELPDAPQFLGANRDGVVHGVKLARNWQLHPPRLLWRRPVGAGWSAFAVSAGRAYTHEQRGDDEVLTCYAALTGKPLWTLAHPAHFTQWQGGEGPRATPTVDRGLIFAYGATGILECAEAATGRRVWSRAVLGDYAIRNLEWGVSASPLVFDETVVVSGGANRGPTLLAFRRNTGELLWQAGTDRASYSSPTLTTLAGRRVILSLNAGTLTAHDPGSGAVLMDYAWSEEKIPKAAQPVVLPGNRVFLSAGYGTGCVMLQIGAGPAPGLTATLLWKNLRMKNQFNTVAAREGFLYGLDDGMLACVNATTGERQWKEGRYGSGQTLLVDDLVIIQSEEGPVVLAAAGPDQPRELGRLDALTSKTWNHPTLAGRLLLVRNDREAVAYELPLAPETPAEKSR